MLVRLAGPGLIVLVALVGMRHFAFGDRATPQDLVRYWLPMFEFLGRSLRSGNIPAWNPFVLSGTPFAADPQSGWMYAPAMALFTALRADIAVRWMVVIQPIIAGLGVYAFLRSEGVSRPAATVGGLVLATPLAFARIAVTIRFPGALAWTAVTLASCSRYFRAKEMSARLVWLVAAALAWGQIAAAHLTTGLLVGTTALVAFAVAKVADELRAGKQRGVRAVASFGVLVAALPLMNLAVLLPRLALSGRTSLGLGYARLEELSVQLGARRPPFPGLATKPLWPLNFAVVPGRYLGAAALLLCFAAFWSRRYRRLAVCVAAFGALCYIGSLQVVARNVPSTLGRLMLVDQYLHIPFSLMIGMLLAMALLAGLGIEAWRERRSPRGRVLIALPALVTWLVLPVTFGAHLPNLAYLLVGGAITAAVLAASTVRTWILALMPVVLAGEVLASSLLGGPGSLFPAGARLLLQLGPAPYSARAYVTPPRLARDLADLDGGRYVYLGGSATSAAIGGFKTLQNNEAMVFGLENVGGYQAVQLKRYWLFVRSIQRSRSRYNYAMFPDPPRSALDLLDVDWIIAPASRTPEPGAFGVSDDGSLILYRRANPPPRVSVHSSWAVVAGPDRALEAVADPGFDPSRSVLLEGHPRISSSPMGTEGATATYRSLGHQAAEVRVDTPSPAVVLVRNMWDPNWRAEVDGRAVRVLPADYVAQGIPVPAGKHTIRLAYDDPTIGFGLLGSGVAVAFSLGAAALLRRKERSRERRAGDMR